MANVNVDETVECAENLTEQLLDSVLDFEEQNLIDPEATDECIYHLTKLAALLGLDIDFDDRNDDYINNLE